MQNMLEHIGDSVEGKTCVISGSGNVATHAAEKDGQLGGKPVTSPDSDGFIHDPEGLTLEKINWVKDLKTNRRGRISEYVEEFKGASYHAGDRPWSILVIWPRLARLRTKSMGMMPKRSSKTAALP